MPVPGIGSAVSIHEELTWPESEYLPDEPAEGATESIEQYANRECLKVASGAVLPAIEERIDSPVQNINAFVEDDPENPSENRIVVDYVIWMENSWEDQIKSAPNIDFVDLVSATPREVNATVKYLGQEYTCELPVVVRAISGGLL